MAEFRHLNSFTNNFFNVVVADKDRDSFTELLRKSCGHLQKSIIYFSIYKLFNYKYNNVYKSVVYFMDCVKVVNASASRIYVTSSKFTHTQLWPILYETILLIFIANSFVEYCAIDVQRLWKYHAAMEIKILNKLTAFIDALDVNTDVSSLTHLTYTTTPFSGYIFICGNCTTIWSCKVFINFNSTNQLQFYI